MEALSLRTHTTVYSPLSGKCTVGPSRKEELLVWVKKHCKMGKQPHAGMKEKGQRGTDVR